MQLNAMILLTLFTTNILSSKFRNAIAGPGEAHYEYSLKEELMEAKESDYEFPRATTKQLQDELISKNSVA